MSDQQMNQYLELDDLRRIFAGFSYRPGWAFFVWLHPQEGLHVTIEADVDNAYDPGASVHLNIHSPLPPFRNEQAVEDWLLWRLTRIETHEASEFLRRDGRQIRNPHDEPAKT
jgi:hypothetical protein